MSNIDQDFVEYIVKSLVGKPDNVQIERRIDEKGVLIELTVDPEDLGRIIGKRGATAQSLRTLLRALGTKNDARYNLKIIDNGPEDYKPKKSSNNDTNQADSSDDNTEDSTEGKVETATEDEDNQSSQPENEPVDQNTSTDSDAESEVEEDQDDSSSRASRTRKELEDLDDLDI
jgi:hypothetical protein